jgi:hypothetical protein
MQPLLRPQPRQSRANEPQRMDPLPVDICPSGPPARPRRPGQESGSRPSWCPSEYSVPPRRHRHCRGLPGVIIGRSPRPGDTCIWNLTNLRTFDINISRCRSSENGLRYRVRYNNSISKFYTFDIEVHILRSFDIKVQNFDIEAVRY